MASPSAQTPLLSPDEKNGAPASSIMASINNTSNNHEQHQELHFYEPSIILNISREVAFGYLILLTGGSVQYEPPTMEEVQQKQSKQTEKSNSASAATKTKQPPNKNVASSSLDEASASLAYAAILDGNVLHTCFGLKASASGSVHGGAPIPNNEQQSSSILCCFPSNSATLDALQSVLPQVTKNKLRMQTLVEILREVMEIHHEELESVGSGLAAQDDTTTPRTAVAVKEPVYIKVIHAYTLLFMSVVRYHDTKKHIVEGETKSDKPKKKKTNYCAGILSSCINWFSKSSSKSDNPKVEQLQLDTLLDVKGVFEGLKEDIWECLERTATKTEFTGVSYE